MKHVAKNRCIFPYNAFVEMFSNITTAINNTNQSFMCLCKGCSVMRDWQLSRDFDLVLIFKIFTFSIWRCIPGVSKANCERQVRQWGPVDEGQVNGKYGSACGQHRPSVVQWRPHRAATKDSVDYNKLFYHWSQWSHIMMQRRVADHSLVWCYLCLWNQTPYR